MDCGRLGALPPSSVWLGKSPEKEGDHHTESEPGQDKKWGSVARARYEDWG